ncbi:MAG: hydroxyquinol 1,2-dioxygenase, partial [Chloroflexi bacterium]|nr:hydroxyquinol 1,2-dioxygenase [Chloroflexota bacterium]
FYVPNPPVQPLGADLGAGQTGEPLVVQGTVSGPDLGPIAGAWVDTWQADADGYYDLQSESDLRLRARFLTDAQGRFWFRTVVPSSYPIPDDGPVGQMLAAQGRHPYRPAHVHFMIGARGYQTLVTHVFLAGDPYLDSDVVFGVKDSLIRGLERDEAGVARLRYDFVLAPARVPTGL